MPEIMPQPYTSPQDFTPMGERKNKVDLAKIIQDAIAAQDPKELARIDQEYGQRQGRYDAMAEEESLKIFDSGEVFETVILAPRKTDRDDHVDFFIQLRNGAIIGLDYTETEDKKEIQEKMDRVPISSRTPLETIPQLGVIPRLVIYSPKGTFRNTVSSEERAKGNQPLPNPFKLASEWFGQMDLQLTNLMEEQPEYRPLYAKARHGLRLARPKYFQQALKQAA